MLPITRVDPTMLEWPSAEERRSETLGGNRDYARLGRVKWSEVREFINIERRVIDEIAQTGDWEARYEDWLEECYEDPFLFGFDLGTNALSAGLAAARCIPFYSCNGGAFDGGHNDSYPLVAFYCRLPIYPFILSASKKASTGLEYNHSGGLNAFGRNVDSLINMAAALIELRAEIDAVRVRPQAKAMPPADSELF